MNDQSTTAEPTPQQVLDLELPHNDSGATTVRGYLVALLTELWREEECFSGKRPFGNSCWQYDVYEPMVRAGMVSGRFGEDDELDDCDTAAADQPTIRVAGDPIAQRDQLAAVAVEALSQRDRLLLMLREVLLYFPPPEEAPGDHLVRSRSVRAPFLRGWWEQIHTLKSIDTTPLALVALAATATDRPPRVPDLPCPKCGGDDVRLVYCRGWQERSRFLCSNKPEHFHRACARCGYDWATFDALDAREVPR